MKVAVINTPFSTHIGRLEYVFRSLAARGHQIEFWGSGDTQKLAERSGFVFRELPLKTDFTRVMQRRLKPHEIFTELFFRIAEEQLPAVLEYCESESPDLLSGHTRVFSSTVASMKTGIQVVSHATCGISFAQIPEDLYGFCVTGDEPPRKLDVMRKMCNEFFVTTDAWFDRHIAKPFGLPRIENSIGLCSPTDTIAQTIRELSKPRIAALPGVHLVGPIVDEPATDIDFESYRPYCYVSLGTSPWSVDEILERYRMLAREIAGSMRLVIGLGDLADRSALALDDDRVTVFERAPQIAAIEHAEFVICHGGCQTVHETLYFGKPLIGIPHHAEINEMVNAVELAGAGVRVAPGKLSAETIRESVERVTAAETVECTAKLGELLRAADGHKNALSVFENIAGRIGP